MTVQHAQVLGTQAGAFYLPTWRGGPRVYLGPTACSNLRELTWENCGRKSAYRGVWVLAHELEHAMQERRDVARFDERQADRAANRRAAKMLRTLERAFKTRCL